MNNTCPFDKATTNVIKGVLLVLMFILHFFCFPSWYVDDIIFPRTAWMEKYQGHFQICVAGFAFLTGYLFFYSGKRTIKYVMKKWLDLLIPYWCVCVLFFSVAYIIGIYHCSLIEIFKELFGLETSIMAFNWYVSFYLLMIPALVLITKNIKSDLMLFMGGLLIPNIISYFIIYICRNDVLDSVLSKFTVYFPIVVMGYISSKREWIQRLHTVINNKILNIIIAIGFILIVFFEPTWLYGIAINSSVFQLIRKCIRIVSIPFFMYGLLVIIESLKQHFRKIEIIFICLGKYSLIMWFLHGMFFNCFGDYLQPVFFSSGSLLVSMVLGMLFCLLLAIPIHSISCWLRGKILRGD